MMICPIIFMLGCYILCNESLVEVNRVKVEVEVDRKNVEDRWSQSGKFEVEDINNKSTEKRSKCRHEMND
jgi:hypothetical protein